MGSCARTVLDDGTMDGDWIVAAIGLGWARQGGGRPVRQNAVYGLSSLAATSRGSGGIVGSYSIVTISSALAQAIRYALNHWSGLILFLDDGRLELDTNTVEG